MLESVLDGASTSNSNAGWEQEEARYRVLDKG